MQIMVVDRKNGVLRTKLSFLTAEEQTIVEQDQVQNCSPRRNKWEQGFEPATFNDRLEAGMLINEQD